MDFQINLQDYNEGEDGKNRGYEDTYGSLKSYVDEKLEERNILSQKPSLVMLSEDKDVMARIMESRKRDFWETEEADVNYKALLKDIESIQIGNQQIEEKVKMELMGIDENPFKRFLYQVFTFFRGIFDKNPETAQDIMKMQLKRVDSVSQGINQASRVINERVSKLSNYYSKIVDKFETGTAYREQLLGSIDQTHVLLDQTEKIVEGSENPGDKLRYDIATKKLRKNLEAKTSELRIVDRQLLDIKEEIPFVDTFESFCQTYSYALKESFQKVQTVKTHLTNVMGLYFEMMRTNHIHDALRESVGQLLEYTNNMGKSLLRAKSLIMGVNNNEIYSYGYDTRKRELDGIMDDVMQSNASTFRNLERKVKNMLSTPFKKINLGDSLFGVSDSSDSESK
ncbi:hypothetical protein GF378_03185 [Candidatus Pacearchaeota archaeon]|nr:hypothetical protein [Candidatus Pacearchaeota archaeon]